MAVHLSFEILNPRFMREGVSLSNYNYLDYEVWIKADNNGTYLGAAQIICSANYSNFVITSLPKFILGPAFNQEPDASDYTYLVTPSWGSNNISIAIVVSSVYNSDPIAWGEFSPVTTSWQLLGTIHVRIANIGPLSGIQFSPSGMDSYQKYKTDIGPLYTAYYDSPNYYIGQDLSYVYLGRLYSSGSGWSQVNGTYNVLTNHWTSSLNTTVWDTSSSAATIDTALALAGKLRINAAARLKINANMALTCSDSTIINSVKGLWISAGTGSGGTGTADGSFIDNGTIVYNTGGTAKEERYLKQGTTSPPPPNGYGWHSLCIPITSTTTAPFKSLYMKWYDEPNHKYRWVINQALDSLLPAAMKGYFMWSDPATTGNYTVGVTGSLNTGSKSIPLTRTNNDPGPTDYDGYNFAGNPYPSATNWVSSGWSLTNVDQSMWFWVDASNGWGVFNRNSPQDSTLGVSRFIPPMQGFYVHVTSSQTSGTLAVNNTARLHIPVPYYKDGSGGYNDRLVVDIEGTGGKDEAVVRFDPSTSTYFNADYDVNKMYGSEEAPQLYSIVPTSPGVPGYMAQPSTAATIYDLPWTGVNQVVPLGFSCGVSGDFTFTASNISSFRTGIEIYLEDKQEPGNAWPDLRTNPVYRFAYTTGEDPSRFILHFTNVYFGISDPTIDAMQIYSYEDFVYVKNITGGNTQGDVFIYDLTGRKIFQDKLQNNPISKYRISVNEGYYLVNVITPDNTYHQKVYLK